MSEPPSSAFAADRKSVTVSPGQSLPISMAKSQRFPTAWVQAILHVTLAQIIGSLVTEDT